MAKVTLMDWTLQVLVKVLVKVLPTWCMRLRVEWIPKSWINGFIDMKNMGINHFFQPKHLKQIKIWVTKVSFMDSYLWVLVIFSYLLPLGSCVWGLNQDLKVELMDLLTWNIWEWIIISTKTPDTNKDLSDKICPYGFISSSLSNFLLSFATWFMHLRADSIAEIWINDFIDMKTMRIEHYFNRNTWYK